MIINNSSSIIFVLLVVLWLMYVFPSILRKDSFDFATLRRPFWKKSVDFSKSRKSFFAVGRFNLKDGDVMRKSLRFCKLLRSMFVFAGVFALVFVLLGLIFAGLSLVSWTFVVVNFFMFVISVVGLRWLAVRIAGISRKLVSVDNQVLEDKVETVVEQKKSVRVSPAVGVSGVLQKPSDVVAKYTPVARLAEKKWSPVPVPRPVYLDAAKIVRPKTEGFSETVYDIFAEGFDVFEASEVVSLEKIKNDEYKTVKAINDLDDVLQRRRVSGE